MKEIATTHLIYPDLHASLPVIERGEGIYLYDREGHRYLDGSSGSVAANIGHGVPEILAAMMEQARKVSFVYRSQFTSEPAEELARLICGLAPGRMGGVFFVNSGSEATELALKVAIQYWQEQNRPSKSRIISRWMSYHGTTLGALSASGHPTRRRRFTHLLAEYPSLAPAYAGPLPHYPHGPASASAAASTAADELAQVIERIGPEHVAAFIAEPIVGAAGGALTPPDGYFQQIREICDRYDVLFIADEVMTGMGRTGAFSALEHWGVTPDLLTLGKGLGAGYTPIAGVLMEEKVLAAIRDGSGAIMTGHTMSANPLSTATALAVVRYVQDQGLFENARVQGERLENHLRAIQSRLPIVGDVRGRGLMWGMELVGDSAGNLFPPEATITQRMIATAFSEGLIVYPAGGALSGGRGDVILIAPPLTIQADEIDELAELLERSLVRLVAEL